MINLAKAGTVMVAGMLGAGSGAAASQPEPRASVASGSEAPGREDSCSRVKDGETITVCAPRLTPFERQFIERPRDPLKDNPWSIQRVMELGDSGTHSCSNSGSSGMSGCEVRSIRRADREGRDASVFGDIRIDLFGRRRP